MTNSELSARLHQQQHIVRMIDKLRQAQSLLSDVYFWADAEVAGKLKVNAEVASLMSCADDCIIGALDAFDESEFV